MFNTDSCQTEEQEMQFFGFKILLERSLQMQRDIFLCFVDYQKAFDRVKHNKVIHLLDDFDIDKKLRITQDVYYSHSAKVRVRDELSVEFTIEKSVRQSCVCSPDLFSLYSEKILHALDEMPGVPLNGLSINNLRYSHDSVLIAQSERGLQALANWVNRVKSTPQSTLLWWTIFPMWFSKNNLLPEPRPCPLVFWCTYFGWSYGRCK